MQSNILQPQSRILQHVPRWSIIRTIRQQSVAEHSYYVTLYATFISQFLKMRIEDQMYITQLALVHDFDEMVTGDIPTPYKANIKESIGAEKYRSASTSMQLSIINTEPTNRKYCEEVVKVADLFEAKMYLMDEFYMGNNTINRLIEDINSILVPAARSLDESLADELADHHTNNVRTRLATRNGLL